MTDRLQERQLELEMRLEPVLHASLLEPVLHASLLEPVRLEAHR